MTFAILCHRDGAKLTQLLGPVPLDEGRAAFKKAVTADSADPGDGQFHGTLELFELRSPRAYKLRHASEDFEAPRKRRSAKKPALPTDSSSSESEPPSETEPARDQSSDPSPAYASTADVPTAGG